MDYPSRTNSLWVPLLRRCNNADSFPTRKMPFAPTLTLHVFNNRTMKCLPNLSHTDYTTHIFRPAFILDELNDTVHNSFGRLFASSIKTADVAELSHIDFITSLIQPPLYNTWLVFSGPLPFIWDTTGFLPVPLGESRISPSLSVSVKWVRWSFGFFESFFSITMRSSRLSSSARQLLVLLLWLDSRISWSFSHSFLNRWTGPTWFKDNRDSVNGTFF